MPTWRSIAPRRRAAASPASTKPRWTRRCASAASSRPISRLAIGREELKVHYQPLAELGSGAVTGFEALLRWDHPRLGPVSPDMFIRLAEESGLIVKLGEWVLRAACREAARWDPPLKLSVNLSPLQFIQDDLVGSVERVLAETGLAPRGSSSKSPRGC